MNPELVAALLKLAEGAVAQIPSLLAEASAIKAAGQATPTQIAALDAQIESLDATRLKSWAAADAALDAASKT